MIKLKTIIHKQPPNNGKYYVVAIDGRGGAGKTTLTEYLSTIMPEFTVIHGDDYFEPDKNTIAFGSFNDKRFAEDVIKPIRLTKSDFATYPFSWHTKPHITKKQVTINEGVFIERSGSFAFDLNYDIKIWVQTPARLALERGQERDEMPLEQGYRSWKEVWQPQEDEHFKKVRPLETSDIVLDGTVAFEGQIA